MEKILLKVNKEDEQKRLDVYIVEKCPFEISRNLVRQAITNGEIIVNGSIKKPHYNIKCGDEVKILLENLEEKTQDTEILPENIPLNILYEDDELIVINKPAGLLVHPTNKIKTGTLVNALMYHIKDFEKHGGDITRLGIVHRLDKDTSGVLVISKTSYSHNILSRQFKDRVTKKNYIALVEGRLKEKESEINLPLGRHPTLRTKRAVVYNGREAITQYKVLKEFNDMASLVWIRLKTGRTHQIRVHFKYLGNPVLGDTLYGKNKFEKFYGISPERQMLHAIKLGFYHPKTEKWLEFLAPLPNDFKELLIKLSHQS
ncbi:RluA family pseudouridine synthase [Petrotoga sp. 9PWA.NaAc.5.4]|uniref:RluA family pseudouridine synthase n=1 Tax=Petrotoga sp. 9PWA.NaAc.5.4 TaxID=1434328 RepID=UPI000CB70637|nr:RluA family pseudouridine synthase [Petrotoga sp. 9PWA.NaAc.5.4]PNR97092.1 pseudouridine synthase [Petrotoga sp. 9PWA.NaAc.5.4]